MAKVWAVWNGGDGYAPGAVEDVEVFPSMAACKLAIEDRCYVGGHVLQDFAYLNREADTCYTPAVDASSTNFWVYRSDPSGSDDPYPDFVVEFGPRGGVQVNPV